MSVETISDESTFNKTRNRKRVALAMTVLLVLAVVVPAFVNANRLRARLAKSVSGSIGRPVSMGNVKIRLLPRPGFEIENFVISDDPAYSAEPMLRAETVVARLRLTSLWRGKLEIARLSFNYPSLNLVRNADGRWNIEGLLQHASTVSAAPTAKKQAEARPRFPYIEADSGRINFKILQDKKAHVLMDADFALWLESENQWNMRLEARPTRTDANLGDTGTLRVEGSFIRADTVEQTPMKLNLELDKSQLGQLTTLIYGRDRGWRGDVRVSAKLEGTPQEFTATAAAQINDFRRYDISSDDSFRISAKCTANYSAKHDVADQPSKNFFECALPVAEGNVTVQGYGFNWPSHPDYFSIKADAVPISSLARLYRHSKINVPGDLAGDGALNGYVSRIAYSDSNQPLWIGQGSVSNVKLNSPSSSQALQVDNIRFGFSQVEISPEGPASAGLKSRLEKNKTNRASSSVNTLTVDPFTVALGGSKPVTITGIGTIDGLRWQIKGDADLGNLFGAARLLGFRVPANPTIGSAGLDLIVDNHWTGFGAPFITGAAQLHRVRTQFTEIASPIEITNANLVLTPQEAVFQKLSAAVGATNTQLDGSLAIPRTCLEQPCPVRFDLHATDLNLDDLNRILNPKFRQTNWLGQTQNVPKNAGDIQLGELSVIGRLTANRLILKALVATNVAADVAANSGTVNLTNVRADVLGGRHRGNWRLDFGTKQARYEGQGLVENASLIQVSALTHENWASGFLNANYKIAMTGTDAGSLRQSIAGTVDFSWKNGAIRTFTAPEFGATLQFAKWTGALNIDSGSVQWVHSEMDSPSGRYRVSGKASLARELKLNFISDKHQIAVSGPLEHPEITTKPVVLSQSESASNQQKANESKGRE